MATNRRQGELVQGVFRALLDKPDGLPAADVLKAVEASVPPTPHEQADYPSNPGVRRYEKTVRFSTIGPVKAGWLVKDKGQWSLTDEGRDAYRAFPDPESFQHEWRKLYNAWKKAQPDVVDESDETDASVDDVVGTLEEAEEGAWIEIRDYLSRMPPYDFQNLSQRCSRQWVTTSSGSRRPALTAAST